MTKRIFNLFVITNITALLIGCSTQNIISPKKDEKNNISNCTSFDSTNIKSDLSKLYGVYRYNSFKDDFDLDVDNEGLLLILPLHHIKSQYKGRIVFVQTCLWAHEKNKITIYDNIEYRGNFLVHNEKILFAVNFDNEKNTITIKGPSPYVHVNDVNDTEGKLSNEYVRVYELP